MMFGQPQFFWVTLGAVPAFALFLAWAWRRKRQLVSQFVAARLLPILTASVSTSRQKARLALVAAALALLLLALARPQLAAI